MKNHRKARRSLYLTRTAGTVSAKYNGDPTEPVLGIPANTRYVQVDVDDAAELDRFVALNLTAEQAETMGKALIGAASVVRQSAERDAERKREAAERNAYWERAAEAARARAAAT